MPQIEINRAFTYQPLQEHALRTIEPGVYDLGGGTGQLDAQAADIALREGYGRPVTGKAKKRGGKEKIPAGSPAADGDRPAVPPPADGNSPETDPDAEGNGSAPDGASGLPSPGSGPDSDALLPPADQASGGNNSTPSGGAPA